MSGNLTRINNNQITDAVGGNTQFGINANTKVQPYSVTSTLLANNLTYGSDLTITGNLSVTGNVTAIDTTNTTIEDPLLLLASNQTGAPTLDIGYIGQRGTSNNIAMVWQESSQAFVTAYTSSGAGDNTTINVLAYADLITGNANITGTLTASNISFTGNVAGNLSITGTVFAGNVSTPGYVSATGNVTGGNIIDSSLVTGQIVYTGPNKELAGTNNFAYAPLGGPGGTSPLVTISDATIYTGNISTTGNVLVAGVLKANQVLSNEIAYADVNGNITGNTNFLFNPEFVSGPKLTITGGIVDTGNVLASNLMSASGNIITGNFFIGDGGYISNINGANVSATKIANGGSYANVATADGNINLGINSNPIGGFYAGGLSLSGDVVIPTGGLYAQNLSLTGNVTSSLNVTLDVSANNISASNLISATGNVRGGNVYTAGDASATGNVYGGNVFAATDLSAGGNVNVTGNINANTLSGTNVGIWSSAGGLDIELAAGGNINVNSTYINNLASPFAGGDAANKTYVDSVAAGLDLKASVEVATTVPLDTESMVTNVAYNNGTAGVGATLTITTSSQLIIDTVDLSTLAANARILIKNELNPPVGNSDAAWNGIYTLTSTGAGSTVLTRSTDFDDEGAAGALPGAFTFDTGGSQNGTGWICITQNPITMGTTPIEWTQFSGGGTYTGGNAIAVNGTVISAKFDNSTIGVNGSNELYIPANAPLTTPNIGAATGTSLSVTGSITGNVINGSSMSITGNIISGNLSTTLATITSITGNVSVENILGANVLTALDHISAGGNVFAGADISAVGNIIGANFTTTGSSGNITGANLISATTFSASGNVYGANIVTANTTINGGVVTTGIISALGNIQTGAYFLGDGGFISNINAANVSSTKISNGGTYANIATPNANLVIAAGVNSNVVATYYDQGVNFAVDVSATGNVLAGASINAVGNVSATGNVTGNNVSANTVNGVTSGSFGNVTIVGSNINSNANPLTINSGLSAIDFAVNGAAANVLYVSGISNTVSIGSNLQVSGATLAINATDSFLMPVGNTAQRPGSPSVGMMRWNTSITNLEAWTGTVWETIGATNFTVIQNEQFNGDGSTVNFTLGSTQTTDSCIVTINGVVQIPTTAYSVSGVDPTCVLTFTEAPQVGDVIDVREITTTTTVTGISNGSGNAQVQVDSTSANVSVTGALVLDGGTGYIYGDGTYLTNVGGGNVVATRIQSGTSQVNIAGPGGDVYMAVAGSNVFDISSTQVTLWGNLNPNSNATQSLGNATNQWSNLWISGNTIYIGGANLAADGSTISYNGSTLVAQSGSGNINSSGAISATGNVAGSSLLASNIISATGNITGGNLSAGSGIVTLGSIVNGGASATGNIGSSAKPFNTIFATATTALYADLAEKYVGDADYEPGTVVAFGGEFEVTASSTDADRRVAGVVSTNPSYIMNGGLDGANIITVALTGRVPTKVTGTVRKGDLMVSNGDGTARAEADPKAGAIIGKALADFDGTTGVIEVVIGVK